MKKTTPYALTFAFLAGYFASNVVNSVDFGVITNAYAEVDGMDYYDLKSDYDFKKAVRRVVESDCSINGSGLYADGEFIWGMSNIDC